MTFFSAASVNHTPATRVSHNDTSHGLGVVLGCRGGGGDAGDEGPAAAAEHRADAGGRLGLGGPGEPRPGDANPQPAASGGTRYAAQPVLRAAHLRSHPLRPAHRPVRHLC